MTELRYLYLYQQKQTIDFLPFLVSLSLILIRVTISSPHFSSQSLNHSITQSLTRSINQHFHFKLFIIWEGEGAPRER
jgi:hypothetical protein